MATGSEVSVAIAGAEQLEAQGVATRVVSMPCQEWFAQQDESYREQVLPKAVKARVSIEAGSTMGWRDYVGDAGRVIGIDHFGASADAKTLFTEFGFTPEAVVDAAKASIAESGDPTPGDTAPGYASKDPGFESSAPAERQEGK